MKRALTFMVVFFVSFSMAVNVGVFRPVRAATNVYGIITSDTTWTKTNSPYTLTGAVEVNQGVTLTIAVGVVVNLKDTYLEVNGTLRAIGSGSDPISFNGGSVRFTSFSSNWNQQTGTGSIIQNAVLNCTLGIATASPRIESNVILGAVSTEGSATFLNNTVRNDFSVLIGSPVIANNVFTNSLISTYSLETSGFLPVIANNTMTRQGVKCYGGNGVGGYALITGNSISGCDTAIFGGASIIKNNYISGNTLGIDTLNGDIENNTFANNVKSINIPKDIIYFFGVGELPNNPTIRYNNFNTSSSNYAIYSTASNNVNATLNWWGTTDPESIHQQIYDYRKDFGIGNVTFTPFLTQPNPSAAPAASTVIPEFSAPALTLVLALATLVATAACFKKRRHEKQEILFMPR